MVLKASPCWLLVVEPLTLSAIPTDLSRITVSGNVFDNPYIKYIKTSGELDISDNTWVGVRVYNETTKKEYDTIQGAIDEADLGKNIIKVFPGDYDETDPIEIVQREGVNIALEAVGDVVLKNQILIYGSTRSDGDETLTIKGFTFDLAGANDNIDIISAPDRLPDNNYSYAHNIKIENNTFIGNPEVDVVAIKTFRAFGLEISNCKGINLHSLAQIRAQSKYFRVFNCTISDAEGGINYYGPSNAEITGLTVYGTEYGIRAGQSSGTINESTLTISDSYLEAQYPVWLRGDAPGTVEITNSNLKASENGKMINNEANGTVNITIDGATYVTSEAELRTALGNASIGAIILGDERFICRYRY
jgi:hypothetical protein